MGTFARPEAGDVEGDLAGEACRQPCRGWAKYRRRRRAANSQLPLPVLGKLEEGRDLGPGGTDRARPCRRSGRVPRARFVPGRRPGRERHASQREIDETVAPRTPLETRTTRHDRARAPRGRASGPPHPATDDRARRFASRSRLRAHGRRRSARSSGAAVEVRLVPSAPGSTLAPSRRSWTRLSPRMGSARRLCPGPARELRGPVDPSARSEPARSASYARRLKAMGTAANLAREAASFCSACSAFRPPTFRTGDRHTCRDAIGGSREDHPDDPSSAMRSARARSAAPTRPDQGRIIPRSRGRPTPTDRLDADIRSHRSGESNNVTGLPRPKERRRLRTRATCSSRRPRRASGTSARITRPASGPFVKRRRSAPARIEASAPKTA